MSLYGSIKEVQNTTEKFYLKLEQRFNENKLIMKLWNQMAQDVSQQIQSLHELPKSFWTRLQKDQNELMQTIKADIKPQDHEIEKDISLSECIEKAIQSEEAVILKIYVPIIRNLRKNWTGQALDFYIMVKAHTVRIKRVAEAFSGDPIVMQHSAQLFQGFEKEIQEPDIEIIQKIKPARKSRTVKGKKPQKPKAKTPAKPKAKPKIQAKPKPKSKTKLKTQTKPKSKPKAKPKIRAKKKQRVELRTKKTAKRSQSPISRSKMRRSRAKPLVEKTDIRRRRARR
jgi:hypothetical protein